MDINLLPREVTPSKNEQKVLSAINKIAMFFCGAFLILVLLGGAIYLVLNNRLDQTKSEGEELAANVQSLQSTEASLILLKDRVQKIKTTLDSRVNEANYAKHNEVLALAPEEVNVESNEIDSSISSLKLNILNSLSLVSLFTGLRSSSNFNSINIEELNFTPIKGFSVLLNVF